MSLLRNSLRSSLRLFNSPDATTTPITSTITKRHATQDYGSGTGSPVGENPQEQGASTKATESREHPGPPPPSTGGSKSTESSEGSAGEDGKPKPKISNEKAPSEAEASEEVKKHNAEVDARAKKTAGEALK